MNSIPQQEVAKGNGQLAFIPTTSLLLYEKSFSNNTFWRLNYFYELLIVLNFELENLNYEPVNGFKFNVL
jgi:hypothetical protein